MSGAGRGPPRLALFLPDLETGGAQRVALALAGGLAARGPEVELIVARAGGPLVAAVPPAVRLVDLGARRLATTVPALARHLRRERPAVLLAILSLANLVALLARALARSPTRIVASEHVLPSIGFGPAAARRHRLLPFLMRHAYPRADAVVAASAAIARDLARTIGLDPARIRVIANPVAPPAPRALARPDHPWLAPGAPPLVLAVGRLAREKDFPTLLRAVALARAERPGLRLMILGEGPARDELQALAAALGLGPEAVTLPGAVADPYPYMAHAGLLALSSVFEGFGLVLVEAMACGCPVVATDCGGPAEILEGGRHGRLVPVGDADSLARAILATLDAPPPPEQLRARAAAFAPAACIDAYLGLLLGLAGTGEGGGLSARAG